MGRKLVSLPRLEADEAAEERAGFDLQEATPTETTRDDGPQTPTERAAGWVEKIKETIPVEVVTAWIAIHALLTVDNAGEITGYWTIFGVVLVVTGLYMWVDVEVPDSEQAIWSQLSPWERRLAVGSHVGLGMGAFVVWALYLLATGDASVGTLPFTEWFVPSNGVARYATVLLVLYTLVGPQLVPQLVSKFLGVRLATPGRSGEDADEGTSG